jgi:hypothetical protein
MVCISSSFPCISSWVLSCVARISSSSSSCMFSWVLSCVREGAFVACISSSSPCLFFAVGLSCGSHLTPFFVCVLF